MVCAPAHSVLVARAPLVSQCAGNACRLRHGKPENRASCEPRSVPRSCVMPANDPTSVPAPGAAPQARASREYAAFISYRHADNRDEGRQWASWLHHALETYEVPADIAATHNDRGERIPERLYPVFRDEEELPADAHLS